ncbi:hypothetical protein HOI83_03310 [Candidatus Uhrbacteria bacterium]|jgi:hypothetical protein|nr:hypothetical protein [Candidatus Uhrbacteria bacterium]
MKSPMLGEWGSMLEVWTMTQRLLPTITRWDKYLRGLGIKHPRTQNSLDHSYSATLLSVMMLSKLTKYVNLDWALLIIAVLVHDTGEAEKGSDTLYIDKTPDDDALEYRYFTERFMELEPLMFGVFQRAFMLQFAGKPKVLALLPENAQRIARDLRERNPLEVLAFDALERWDYMMYPLEHFSNTGDHVMLLQVLRHQIPHMGRLVDGLPGFGEEIWTHEVHAWAQEFVLRYEGQHIEQKKS